MSLQDDSKTLDQEKNSPIKNVESNNKDGCQEVPPPRPPKFNHPENRNHNNSPPKNKRKGRDWALLAQIGLFLATVATLGVIAKSTNISRHQLEEMRDSTEQSEIALQKQNRAYVYVDPGNLYNLHTNGSVQSYTYIGNGGHTVALNVKRFVGMKVLERPGTDAINNIDSLMVPVEGVMILSPRITPAIVPIIKELPNKRKLTVEEIDAIKNGKKRVYMFGKITYEDVYGHKHIFRFSHMYYGKETCKHKPSGTGYCSFQAKYCDKHNYAD